MQNNMQNIVQNMQNNMTENMQNNMQIDMDQYAQIKCIIYIIFDSKQYAKYAEEYAK